MHIAAESLAAANWQRVDIAKLQDLRDIERRNRSLGPQIVRILDRKSVAVQATTEPRNAVVGSRSIVDGLGDGIGNQELKATRKGLLHSELGSVVDRIRDRRRVPGKRRELWKGQLSLERRNGRPRERTKWVGNLSEE